MTVAWSNDTAPPLRPRLLPPEILACTSTGSTRSDLGRRVTAGPAGGGGLRTCATVSQ